MKEGRWQENLNRKEISKLENSMNFERMEFFDIIYILTIEIEFMIHCLD